MPSRDPQSAGHEVNDEALMGRYVDGDAAAFDELFRRYEKRAFAYFAKRTRSAERAQDLYQELFLRVHRARHEYDVRRAFAPWFFQIARRLLIDDQRRAYRSHEISLEEMAPHTAVARLADPVCDRDELAHLLSGLSDVDRYVFLAAKGNGEGYSELAEELGKTVDAVKKMASRALQRLQRAAIVEASAPVAGR